MCCKMRQACMVPKTERCWQLTISSEPGLNKRGITSSLKCGPEAIMTCAQGSH